MAYESHIDRQIREAQERGEFDNLPGIGKPLPDRGELYDEDWWLKSLIKRENITGVLPAHLALRKEAEDLLARTDSKKNEAAVRELVDELNARILAAGLALKKINPEDVVRLWRSRRAAGEAR